MRKVVRVLIILLGMALGPLLVYTTFSILESVASYNIHNTWQPLYVILTYVASGLITGAIVALLSKRIVNGLARLTNWIEAKLSELPLADVIAGIIGLLVGWIIALFLSLLVSNINIPVLYFVIMALLYIFLGYLGWSIATKRRKELSPNAVVERGSVFKRGGRAPKEPSTRVKILDTSVIIDGRILDICLTGFVEGTLIVPGFVLQELRHIADSADGLKRNRGRRGLDILKRMQDELENRVRIVEKSYNDVQEVDEKLLRMAKDMGGVVLTNDFNLNKVADVQKVKVLNINELANAIKPVLLPGEELKVQVVKEGKESGQGVAYLDDGTMIVVEGGRRYVSQQVQVQVTSVLQTSAGRMIFAKYLGTAQAE